MSGELIKDNIKLAVITAGDYVGGLTGTAPGADTYDMYSWGRIFNGWHFSFNSLKDDGIKMLKNAYDVLIISGNPAFFDDIIRICHEVPDAVKIFFPEGDTSLYFRYAIDPKVIDALDACDIIGAPEEDRLCWWQSLTRTPVRFLHVPVPRLFYNFFVPRERKLNFTLVYGDNNPNNPITALNVVGRLNLGIIAVKVGGNVTGYCERKKYCLLKVYGAKLAESDFFAFWRDAVLMVYPTSWIGTARQNIVGALCGAPCIGSRDSHTQKRLFPELAVDIWDIDAMVALGERLLKDIPWYESIAKYAHHEALFYNEKEAVRRLMAMIEEVKK